MPIQFINHMANERKAAIRAGFGPLRADENLDWIKSVGQAYAVQALAGAINGTTGSDGNAIFTYGGSGVPLDHFLVKNGLKMIQGTHYTLAAAAGIVTITFLPPHIPVGAVGGAAADQLEFKLL